MIPGELLGALGEGALLEGFDEEGEDEDNGVKVIDVDVKATPEDIARLGGKRAKQDMVKKHKNRQDYVRDALSTLSGMLAGAPDCDEEGGIFDEGYEYLGEDKQSPYGARGALSGQQEYASNLNRHSKAGGV